MKTLHWIAVSLFLCSCYEAAPPDDAFTLPEDDTDTDADTDIGLDCEQACDVEVACNEFFDELGAYVECLEFCDEINEQTIAAGELDDADCVNDCYAAFEAGVLDCDDMPVCITGGCKPWWAQG